MKPKILVTRKLSDGAEEKLNINFEVTLNPKDEPIPSNELIKMANEYDGFISTGFDKIGEEFFKDLNGKLKIIAQVGVGYDNISVKSAENKKLFKANNQTPWQEIFRDTVGQLEDGACINSRGNYLDVSNKKGLPRNSH